MALRRSVRLKTRHEAVSSTSSSKPSARAEPAITFASLPAEIKSMIYLQVVLQEQEVTNTHNWLPAKRHGLAGANKETHQDMVPIFYRESVFYLVDNKHARIFIRAVGRRCRPFVRHVDLVLLSKTEAKLLKAFSGLSTLSLPFANEILEFPQKDQAVLRRPRGEEVCKQLFRAFPKLVIIAKHSYETSHRVLPGTARFVSYSPAYNWASGGDECVTYRYVTMEVVDRIMKWQVTQSDGKIHLKMVSEERKTRHYEAPD